MMEYKKEGQVPFSQLEQSVHILNVLSNNLVHYFQALTRLHEVDADSVIIQAINQMTFEYGTVIINSYLDEYHDHFYPSLDIHKKDEYGKYFKIIKKEAINRFPGIKDYRNHVTAHQLREKGKSIYLHGNFRKYKVPQNIFEFRYLITAIQVLTALINQSFPGVFENVKQYVNQRFNNDTTPYQPEMTAIDAEMAILDLVNQLTNVE